MASILQGLNQVVEFPSSGPAYADDSAAKNVPGMLIRHGGKVYRYVKFDSGTGTVASVAGGVVHWKTLTPASGVFTVTSDYTDAIGGINTVAGVTERAAITDLYWTWIAVGGRVNALCAASTVAGDKCIGSSTDNTFGRVAAGTDNSDIVWAVALETVDPTLGDADVLLQNLAW
jgi:hypothetical protein